MSLTRFPSALCLLGLLASAAACGTGPAPPPEPAAPTGRPVDQATTGAISGRVAFDGTPPPAERIDMGTDRACVQVAGPNPQSDAVLIGLEGGLANAFVYVKEGLDAEYRFDLPAEPAVLGQKGCVYSPRVFGVRTGQPIDIVNSDPTLHNVHAMPARRPQGEPRNPEFNEGQPVQGMRASRTFTVPEVMVRFKCDVHGWMAAYVGVLPHPFFAVSGADGSFEIAGLPPGEYTVEAWHEVFGTREQRIVVGERETQAIDYTFTSAAAPAQ
jgi:hypothetical protein